MPVFGEEALGIPVPAGLRVYQTNIEGMEKAQYVSSAIEGGKPAFYFLIFWGKFSKDGKSEGMPDNIGGAQLVFNTSAKNIDRVDFNIAGRDSTNFIFTNVDLTDNVYKNPENGFDLLGLIGALGNNTNSYSGGTLTFWRDKKLLESRTLTAQDIMQLKKVMPFAKDLLAESMRAIMTAILKMMEAEFKKSAQDIRGAEEH